VNVLHFLGGRWELVIEARFAPRGRALAGGALVLLLLFG